MKYHKHGSNNYHNASVHSIVNRTWEILHYTWEIRNIFRSQQKRWVWREYLLFFWVCSCTDYDRVCTWSSWEHRWWWRCRSYSTRLNLIQNLLDLSFRANQSTVENRKYLMYLIQNYFIVSPRHHQTSLQDDPGSQGTPHHHQLITTSEILTNQITD